MNTHALIVAANFVCNEIDNLELVTKSNKSALSDARRVVFLLKEQLENNTTDINLRVLRGMHDIGMSAYKDFENTELEIKINHLTDLLFKEIPIYKTLKPLRSDFGKENPI